MTNKNEEILDVLEDNNRFRVIRLVDTIVYAKDKYEAAKKSKKMKSKDVTESRIIQEKKSTRQYGIAVNYDWVTKKNEIKEYNARNKKGKWVMNK